MKLILPVITSPARSLYTLLGAVMLAIIHQYLFYAHAPGLSIPIFILLFYGFILGFAGDRLHGLSPFAIFMFAVIFMLSITYLLFDNPIFYVLNILIIPTLVAYHVTLLLGYKPRPWWKAGIMKDMLLHLIPRNLRHFPTAFTSITSSYSKRVNEGSRAVSRKILFGLAISAPLVIIVISLLSSADGMFERLMFGIPRWLDEVTYSEGFFRFMWIFLFTLFFFGYVYGFVQPVSARKMDSEIAYWKETNTSTAHEGDISKGEFEWDTGTTVIKDKIHESNSDTLRLRIDPIIASTVLTMVNVVYLVFVILQFTYLFGAFEGALPEGMTYADYARRGFAELMLVALLNFGILMTILLYTENRGSSRLRLFQKGMLYILVICSIIILYSAFSRLTMYEEAYGFTYLRFLVHAFMLLLAVLMVIAGLRIHFERIPLAKCYIVFGLAAYVAINYAGMDTYIAEKNIERYHIHQKMDTYFLSSLSMDAVPVLIEFSRENPEIQIDLRADYNRLNEREQAWWSFNLAEYRAHQALKEYFEQE
ncbi:DUF4153 domain-containing protein [Paenibacillus provencensis]|uniref:DUF4153 domain-containing protein n=1 Tax=Paenibacillus provencensis TaxID=441151 RepID=A0ABW3PT93_9BACL|nr:DUF4173 domain-containing protein [Paenibacillus sp. MER 78]MCM3126987.1 DUF4173 domain-containing protein [Paenibacillus sp. MER 78]